MPSPRVRRWYCLAAALVLAAAPLRAQEGGTVAGNVRDVTSGTARAGVRVEARNASGQVVASAVTDAAGSYRLSLPAGSYTLVISGPGFEPRSVRTTVTAGGTVNMRTEVALTSVQLDPVVVSASRAPEKALDAPARVEVVGEREIEARPVTTPVDHLRAVPGVDVAQTGIQSSNVVTRGFNNIFSGALHALTDNRIAGVPSLRVNFMHFVPSNNEDIQRMEVVLGPGAALYGPNTSNGVLHILTKSPLAEQGTTLTVGGGERSVLTGEFRTAHLLSDNFGIKFSGSYLQGDEWRYTDPAEVAEQQKFASNLPFFRADLMRASGISAAEADLRIARIGSRDFDLQRYSGEARADWRMGSDATMVVSAGATSVANGIELTGLGAAQVQDWTYSYAQLRTTWNRFFAQIYVNQSNAGDTYLLRNGAPITDESRLMVAQLQHGASIGDWQRFTYGTDFLLTTPVTKGSINGLYEDDDETREFGAYLQSETKVVDQLSLVLAGRMDTHSALPDPVFSPRAALVWKPAEEHAFRVSYNRAFSTPSSLNQFLDLGSSVPSLGLARLGYSLRVQGTGRDGFSFMTDGGFYARSPFTPAGMGGPTQLLPAGAIVNFFPAAVQVVAAQAAANGQPLDPNFVAWLASQTPTGAQIGVNYLNAVNNQTGTLASLTLPDIDPIRESPDNTFEAGYKGILGGRFLISADAWFSRKENLVTPLTIQTPLLLLNPQQTGAFLVARMMAPPEQGGLGMSQAQAVATANALTPGLASVPLGVISSQDVHANGAQLLVTYVNVDETLETWGADISMKALVTDTWSLGGSMSYVSQDTFQTRSAGLVTLNAPRFKGTVTLGYDNPDSGLNGEFRVRHADGFPVNSGVYIGTACLGVTGPLVESCVASSTLLDVNLGYRIPGWRNTTLQLNVSNLLDEAYRPFPGTPSIGRMVLARVKYEF